MKKGTKHYETRSIKYQERINKYLGDSKHDICILEHEALVIFCIETGESHIVKHDGGVEIIGKES